MTICVASLFSGNLGHGHRLFQTHFQRTMTICARRLSAGNLGHGHRLFLSQVLFTARLCRGSHAKYKEDCMCASFVQVDHILVLLNAIP